MAKKKTSKFGVDEELFLGNEQQAQEVQKEIGSTQGKKGEKLKRMTMAFSDVNYKYMTLESRRRGLSATAFVNKIIDGYRKNEGK